jgi:hypothetical protein
MRFVSASLTVLILSSVLFPAATMPQAAGLPGQLGDAEFWRIFTEFSEPGGSYPYENFVTNEETIQDILGVLTKVTKPGGVYLGVGPEQNFTYISGLKPKMAFIFDIRRQNAIEHFLYKAIFEMSPTRADFVSHLFSIKTTEKVPPTARANGLFLAFEGLKGDRAYYTQNLTAIKNNLSKHAFALSRDDLQKIEYIYDVFFRAGPQIDYKFESSFPSNMAPAPNYIQAMTDTDADKKAWSFLASEENYQVVRDLQMKNLLIPIVGDFAGPSAVRKVGDYVRQRNGIISAFYVSNVENYLGGPGSAEQAPAGEESLQRFYQNVASLPVDSTSLLIRFVGSPGARNLRWWRGNWLQAVSPMIELRDRIRAGGRPTYDQALQMIPDPKTLVR